MRMCAPHDMRFDNGAKSFNASDVKIVAIDGDTTHTVAKIDFPNAQILALPDSASSSDLLLSVTAGKADVVFVDEGVIKAFLENNPNSLRRVAGLPAVRIFSEVLAVKRGEFLLRDALNVAIRSIIHNGKMEKIIRAYSPGYLLPADGFK